MPQDDATLSAASGGSHFFGTKHDTAIPAGRHRTDKAASRTRWDRVLEHGMNITEAEFDALEYVAVVGHVATHDGPHISSLLERLRPFAKRESDSPQPVASTPETHATPSEGTSQRGCAITREEREAIAYAAEAVKLEDNNIWTVLQELLERLT